MANAGSKLPDRSRLVCVHLHVPDCAQDAGVGLSHDLSFRELAAGARPASDDPRKLLGFRGLRVRPLDRES